MLAGKRILLVIGGGIAAYKALDLIRRLRERGAAVKVVLTAAAKHFVTPLSVASLSANRVYDDLFSLTDEAEMGHIELSRDADLLVIAPATADLIAKAAHGLADDLATTLLLATDKKALFAPAMNLRMWISPATQRNVARLKDDGASFVGPNDGEMACGEFGPGRMSEPLEIVAAVAAALDAGTVIPLPPGVARRSLQQSGLLAGKRVVVTSGPTHEPIDPVRYLANRSSGIQGHAIARAAAAAGAQVTLISGPVTLADPQDLTTFHVETAREMLAAVERALPADIFIAAAAVADWRVADVASDKIKKGAARPLELHLVENPDILATVARPGPNRPRLVVGFAAETRSILDEARRKLTKKQCDLVVANDVGSGSGVMGGLRNTVHLVSAAGVESWPTLDKEEVAERLVLRLAQTLGGGIFMSSRVAVRRLPHAEGLPLPAYQSAGAAGLDLVAAIAPNSKIILEPGARELVPTGLVLQLPEGFEGQIRPRSGLALASGVTVLNAPGTIDADYRGEIGVILINHGGAPFEIVRGMRIAQLVVARVDRAVLFESIALDHSARGAGGFGSTGNGRSREADE